MTSKSTGYIKSNIISVLLCAVVFVVACLTETIMIKEEVVSRTLADVSADTDSLELLPALQSFIPAYSEIKSIGIDIGKKGGRSTTGILTLTLYNQQLDVLGTQNVDIADMKDSGLTDISTGWKVSPGQIYFVGVECAGCDEAPVLHYRSKSQNAPKENLDFYYGPTVVEDATANISYTYLKRPSAIKLLYIYISTAFIMMMAAGFVKRNEKQ